MGLGVAQIQRVDHQADVRRVLARLTHVGNLDQLERRLMHAGFERLVALPVTVRLLNNNAALQQQPLQHLLHVELGVLGVAHAQREVLEIAEQRHILNLRLSCHACSPCSLWLQYRHHRRPRRAAWLLPPCHTTATAAPCANASRRSSNRAAQHRTAAETGSPCPAGSLTPAARGAQRVRPSGRPPPLSPPPACPPPPARQGARIPVL